MFHDRSLSKNINDQYRTYCEDRHPNGIGMSILNNCDDCIVYFLIDFSVMVLTSNSWPFSVSPSLVLPIEVRV